MEINHRTQPSHSGGKTVVRYAAGIAVLAVLFAIGLAPKLQNNAALTAASHEASTEVPEVELASPHFATADNLLLPGNVQALAETAVQARTSGYIQKLFVDIGSHVKAGQVLATIQSPDADQQYVQAVADTAKSRATVGQSVADVAHSEAGVAQSRADLVRQQANIKQAQAALAGARARLLSARANQAGAVAKLAQSKQVVETQRANLSQAEAQYQLASTTVKRYEGLLKEGFVAQQDYDQAAATFKTTGANVQAVKANIQAAQADVNAAEQAVQAAAALVQSAQSDADAARANVGAAEAAYNSQEANVTAAQASVQASRATVQANQAAVSSSEANARRYGVLSSFQRVVAPFDGVITARNVDLGSLVSPGAITAGANNTTPSVGLFGIARIDTLRIFVNLPQTDYQAVKPGDKAKIFIREIPNKTFVGTVAQSSGALDATTRTLLTEIRLPNPGGALLPGMYAQVQIAAASGQPSLRIPSNTLVVDAQGTRVAVVDSTLHVHFHNVTVGKDYGTEVEILKGLSENDRLVSNPGDDLKDGQAVKVAEAHS